MQVTGKLKFKGEVKEFGTNGFTKRDIVVQTDEQYPQDILIELHKDKTSLVDSIEVGADIVVSINLRGREWTSEAGEVRYFNSLVGWRIENQPLASDAPAPAPSEAFDPAPVGANSNDDDLPF